MTQHPIGRRRLRPPWALAAAVLLAAAIALLAFALFDATAVARLVRGGVETTGTVTFVQTSAVVTRHWGRFGSIGSTSTVRTASVEFADATGTHHVVRSAPTVSDVSVREIVRVVYPADAPDRGRAFVGWPWTYSTILFGAALLVGALAYVPYAMGRNAAAKQPPLPRRESRRPPGHAPERPR